MSKGIYLGQKKGFAYHGDRVQVEIRVQRAAGVIHDIIAWLGAGNRLDGRVVVVETVQVVDTVSDNVQYSAADGDCDFSPYSEVIDVRAPAEYAEDHVPGALNLPVLNDAERAEVGTLYKQHSPFAARRRGAALVTHNIGALLSGPLADRPADYRPLIYCWRGGMRSRSLALVLGQVGWRTTVLRGGYRHYRGWVRERLPALCRRLRLLRLAGPTGCGKTALLALLAARGAQVLDLEGLARHRGSVLGADPAGPQPAQKLFESLLLHELDKVDPRRPLWVESESSKIGRLHCPQPLWEKMKAAPVVQLDAPAALRAELLLDQYRHYISDPPALKRQLTALGKHVGRAELQRWFTLIDQGRWQAFVEAILMNHYDRTYASLRGGRRGGSCVFLTRLVLDDLSPAGLERCAARLASDLAAVDPPC